MRQALAPANTLQTPRSIASAHKKSPQTQDPVSTNPAPASSLSTSQAAPLSISPTRATTTRHTPMEDQAFTILNPRTAGTKRTPSSIPQTSYQVQVSSTPAASKPSSSQPLDRSQVSGRTMTEVSNMTERTPHTTTGSGATQLEHQPRQTQDVYKSSNSSRSPSTPARSPGTITTLKRRLTKRQSP